MMAWRAVELPSAWCMGGIAEVILGRVFVQQEWVAVDEDQSGGDSAAQSLRNRNAGDTDARHLADGHLA